MEIKFTQNELTQFRPILNTFGTLYGKVIVMPTTDNLDLSHGDKVKDGRLHFSKPIPKYMSKAIVMTKFELSKDPNGKTVLVVNDDPQLTFPITTNSKPKIMECSTSAINDAIERFRETKQPTFFTDVEKVVDVITQLNEDNARTLEEHVEECLNFAASLREINKTERLNKDEYLKSLNF